MTIRIWIGIAGASALAALAAWYFWPQTLDAVHPRIGPAIMAVYASGTVEASVMLPVAPRVGARLTALNSDEHGLVRKGNVLGRLESDDLAGNIAQLTAQATFAKSDFDRYAALMRENAIARQTYDRALTSWHAAEAAVRQARAQAGFMSLVAPDDCIVIERDGEVGQFIAANTPVFWLSCHASLRIAAQVDEEDIALVRAGQKVLIRADAFPGRIFDGSVTEVTPKGDPVGRSYRVRIALPAGSPLQIGMTAESNIVIHTEPQALLLPAGAVVDGNVWKVENGRAVRVRVTTGVKDSGWVQIVKGVVSGDVILRDGNAALLPNRKLNIRLASS